jgi:leucyl-tRNA synthetase
VFLVAATLRPETMYRQTNCFVLPSGEYGIFEMKNNELFVCSQRSAVNISYQDLTQVEKETKLVMNVLGEKLIDLN